MTDIAQPRNQFLFILFNVLQWLGPLLLAAIAGYGAVQFAQGQSDTRLRQLEADAGQMKTEQQRFVTREEFRLFMDDVREDLREIKTDVRAVRAELTGR